jgi:hypothetical protein
MGLTSSVGDAFDRRKATRTGRAARDEEKQSTNPHRQGMLHLLCIVLGVGFNAERRDSPMPRQLCSI